MLIFDKGSIYMGIKFDGKNTFVITQKGRMFLEEYTRFHEFAGAYGMEM